MKTLFTVIWYTIISYFPAGRRHIKHVKDRAVAERFSLEIDIEQRDRKNCRKKCQDTPYTATVYDWLYGHGFDPSKKQIQEIERAAKAARCNGWKFITPAHLAKAMVGTPRSLAYVADIGLDSAINRAKETHWGTITKNNIPSRNSKCPCGSGKKFKTCCLHKFN